MYLLANREKPVTPEAIIDSIWGEQQYANPGGTIKNFVHRLRQTITNHESSPSAPIIISTHGCYSLNPGYPCWLDTDIFQGLCREAAAISESNPLDACAKYSEALKLYGGDYLPEFVYSDWLMPFRYQYRRLYIETVETYTALLRKLNRYQKVLEECEKAIAVECFEEEFHLIYIDALLALKKISQARAHYEHVSALLYKEFGTPPSQAMQNRYGVIRRQGDNTEINFVDIREMLLERDEAKGALYCERDFFRILCRLEKRRAERDNKIAQLGLLTVRDSSRLLPGSKVLEATMNRISDVISKMLRKGDIFTVWKQGQYAVLLPGAEAHQAEEVITRLHDKYNESIEGGHCLPLDCSVIPVASSPYT